MNAGLVVAINLDETVRRPVKKNILVRTNFLVCLVIILGFAITSVISYQSNLGIFRKDVENVSSLTSEGIYYQIESLFTRPVNVSLTMANDSLLKEFLSQEKQRADDEDFIQMMRTYLNAYREKYSYDSVFLVSAGTSRYYHFNGLDRTLGPDNPENVWYYQFLEADEEYSLNIDNDEAADNEITAFINCAIKDSDGSMMGVVGVGFLVDGLQSLLSGYEEDFGVRACLVDESGMLQVSTDRTGYEKVNLFDVCAFPELKGQILQSGEEAQTFWHESDLGKGYVVAQYVPNLKWHLVVEKDTSLLDRQLNMQLIRGILVILVVIGCVLITITSVLRSYNSRIVQLTVAREQEHRNVFQEVTEQLYENIYELDVTHNRAASEATEHYFESLGVPKNTPFNQALEIIAHKQIKEEYRRGYIAAFTPENVLKAYAEGKSSLQYDFKITNDGQNYYWMRITARLFRWEEDDSIRMLVYRQNIDEEKSRERYLFDQMQKDSLTGLLNKAATQERIGAALAASPEGTFAFFILDIDDFKQVNDQAGHAMGDAVLIAFASTVKSCFRKSDVAGRIGGDEFVAFCSMPGREQALEKARELSGALNREVSACGKTRRISASIGVALAPEDGADFETLYRNADAALYETKKNGKSGFSLYSIAKSTGL